MLVFYLRYWKFTGKFGSFEHGKYLKIKWNLLQIYGVLKVGEGGDTIEL